MSGEGGMTMTGDIKKTVDKIKRTLLQSTPVDGMPGWETRLYLIEYAPGADGSGHHHPVVGLGYVVKGDILSAFDGEEVKLIRQGESFVDAAHKVHSVARNASETEPVSFLVAYTVKQGEPVTVYPQ
jgi:quercetin dioxygenase-like cupin family protein